MLLVVFLSALLEVQIEVEAPTTQEVVREAGARHMLFLVFSGTKNIMDQETQEQYKRRPFRAYTLADRHTKHSVRGLLVPCAPAKFAEAVRSTRKRRAGAIIANRTYNS